MASYLADTAILVDLLRGYSPARAWLDSLPVSEVAVSAITAAELLAGCRNSNEQRIVEQELALYRILMVVRADFANRAGMVSAVSLEPRPRVPGLPHRRHCVSAWLEVGNGERQAFPDAARFDG